MPTDTEYTREEMIKHFHPDSGDMVCNRDREDHIAAEFWPCHLDYQHQGAHEHRIMSTVAEINMGYWWARLEASQRTYGLLCDRISNLQSLLARERLFRRQWEQEARRIAYTRLPNL